MVEKKRTKNIFAGLSLKANLAIFILIGMAIAFLTFIAVRFGINQYVNTVYMSEERVKQREEEYISDFQSYINRNEISSADGAKFSEWAKAQKYVYMLIYKDDELFYSSDTDYGKEDEKNHDDKENPDAGEDNDTDKDEGDSDSKQDSSASGGITVNGPTLEQLKEYAERNDQHVIELKDGPVIASIAEFSEYLYYDLSNIAGIVLAVIAFALIIIIFFIRIASKISRLASDVNRVSGGDMEHKIVLKGDDELSRLSRDVDKMRNSILYNLMLEREAREANEELITSMSHDIRTPLTVLLGYLDIMKTVPHDTQMNEYIKASESTALRLKKLSDDMFNYFLVFGNKSEGMELSEYDAAPLTEQLLSEHILLLNELGYTVDYGIGELSDVKITTDPPALMRIIDNLFSNITKYADISSPISIKAEYFNKSLKLTMINKIRMNAYDVESNGIGLKTCKKLSELLGIGFLTLSKGDVFTVKMALPASRQGD